MIRASLSKLTFSLVFLLININGAYAEPVSCIYFYRPLPGLKNFTVNSDSRANTTLSLILRDALSKHFSITEITPHMTVDAFTNFINLIDPMRVLISHEDLKKVNYPNPNLFGEIQYNLVMNGTPSTQHTFLLRLVNERLDSYVRKFLHNEAYRTAILDRANSLLNESSTTSIDRPATKAEVEDKVQTFIAFQLIQIAQNVHKTYTPQIQKSDLSLLIRSLRETVEAAKKNYPTTNIEQLVTKSYLNTLDQHTDLILPHELANYKDMTGTGSKTKLGTISEYSAKGYRIKHVTKDSAAEKAGLQPDDILTAVEVEPNSGIWQSLRNKTLKDFTQYVSGEPGTRFRLRVRRDNSEFETFVTRQSMSFANFMVGVQGFRDTPAGPIMNIKLTNFARGSAHLLHKEISKNLSKDLKGIVLDLRGNPGGLVNEMTEILQLFVSKPYSMFTKSRFYINEHTPLLKKLALWDGPLVVLVDQGSASAAEALSAALKSYKRAVIIGGPQTYGKGSMQDFNEKDNALYKVTTALFFSPSGLPIQWRGVDADILLPITNAFPSEREGKNSLKPAPLSEDLPDAWPVITNLDSITDVLRTKSKERSQRITEDQTPDEIYQHNTEEAYRILADWVEIDPSGNGI